MWWVSKRRIAGRWTAVKFAAALTFIALVVGVFLALSNSCYGECRRLKLFQTDVVTAGQSVKMSTAATSTVTVEAFRGRIIHDFDQVKTDVDANSIRCVNTRASGMTFPICVYEAKEDVWVSKSFIGGGYFEQGLVGRFVDRLRHSPDLELVDLGANIGTFTLPAARIAHVVAVEPYSKSMARLMKSVKLGGVERNVSLVFNAISNERSTFKLGFYTGNVGGTYLKASDATDCGQGSCTETILLDDLLPLMRGRRAIMKVDVEAHQHRVFTNKTASKFFEAIDVPFILMEWNLCKSAQDVGSEIHDLIRFFTSRRYQIFAEDERRLHGPDCRQWSGNIVLKKQLDI